MTTDLDGQTVAAEHDVVTEARRLQGAHGARLIAVAARRLRQAAARLAHTPTAAVAGQLRLH